MKKAICLVALLAIVGTAGAATYNLRFWLVPDNELAVPAAFDRTATEQSLETTDWGDLFTETPAVSDGCDDDPAEVQGYYIFGQWIDTNVPKGRKVQGAAFCISTTDDLQVNTTWYQFSGAPIDEATRRWETGSDFGSDWGDHTQCKLVGIGTTGWLNNTTDYDTGDLFVEGTPSFYGQSTALLGYIDYVDGFGCINLGLAYDGISISGNEAMAFFGNDTVGVDAGVDDAGGAGACRYGPDGIPEGGWIPEPASLLLLGLAGFFLRRR